MAPPAISQMRCPHCGYGYSKASSTNKARNGAESRRNRWCMKCHANFITYEILAADYQFLQAARKWMDNYKHAIETEIGMPMPTMRGVEPCTAHELGCTPEEEPT